MNKLFRYFWTITALSVLLFASSAFAETAVWKVSKGKSILYIAGTCHLLNESDHPLPPEFERAYQAADEIVFETDIGGASTPEFQMKFMQALSLSDGKTLKTSLKPETYKSLADFMASRQLPIDNFAPFSPGGVTLVLTVMEYQRLGMSQEYGVDTFFNSKAQADKKTIGFLESLDTQLTFIANMGVGQEDEMVLYSLRELEKAEETIADIKKYWREGKNKEMDELAIKEMREKFNDTYKELIVQRNNNWLPQIEAMLADANTEAVMVGALHLAGPDGLLAMLSAKGYDVKQL